MILESLRIVSDWLQDVTLGVNSHLAALTLDGADVRPDPVATVAEESSSSVLAFKRLSQVSTALPALGVWQAGAFDLLSADVSQSHADANGRIAIWYLSKADADAEVARQAGLYTMRAVRQSLRDLMRDGTGAKSRGGVQLITLSNLAMPPSFSPIEGLIVTASLEMTAVVRDTTI